LGTILEGEPGIENGRVRGLIGLAGAVQSEQTPQPPAAGKAGQPQPTIGKGLESERQEVDPDAAIVHDRDRISCPRCADLEQVDPWASAIPDHHAIVQYADAEGTLKLSRPSSLASE
jgi:hypothetical protein